MASSSLRARFGPVAWYRALGLGGSAALLGGGSSGGGGGGGSGGGGGGGSSSSSSSAARSPPVVALARQALSFALLLLVYALLPAPRGGSSRPPRVVVATAGGGGFSSVSSASASLVERRAVAGAAAAALASRRTGVCYDDPALYPLLWACRKWREEVLAGRRIDIVLVANELWPQFPLAGYGGIETTVEATAWALHAMGVPFWAVTPGRVPPRPAYPFAVLETVVAPNGKGGLAGVFVDEVSALLAARADALGANTSAVEAAHAAAGSAPDVPDGRARDIVVWGQSEWSQAFAGPALAMVTSHHDGNGAPKHWDWRSPYVGHRFLCDNQRSQWVRRDDAALLARTRIIGHGSPPEAFVTCPDGGYFLWVASLDWGWEEKGLNIFVEMARREPGARFLAYGSAATDVGRRALEALVRAQPPPNFEFKGQLMRGDAHTAAFCGATAFFMPTQLGESFGMVVLESLSKGVPVITSTIGAPADILEVPDRRGFSPLGAACSNDDEYFAALQHFRTRTPERTAAIQDAARLRFSSALVVEHLLRFSMDVMDWHGSLDATEKLGHGAG